MLISVCNRAHAIQFKIVGYISYMSPLSEIKFTQNFPPQNVKHQLVIIFIVWSCHRKKIADHIGNILG